MNSLQKVLDALPRTNFDPYMGMYGCLGVLADYSGTPHSRILRGYIDRDGSCWQHGWHPPEHNFHPEAVVGTSGDSIKQREWKRFFVARNDQSDYLRLSGYKHVFPIGLPIVYVKRPILERMPRSLLIMPSHGLAETTESWDFEAFMVNLKSILHKFDFALACVHESCLKKGYWLKELASLNIPIVNGADHRDSNSLLRTVSLLSMFSHVVSNGFGSQFAYASCFGAKPFIIEPWAERCESDYSGQILYQNCPDAVRGLLNLTDRSAVKKYHPQFFDMESSVDIEWGMWQLGANNKKSPAEIRRLMGWDIVSIYSRRIQRSFGRLRHAPVLHRLFR
jgi:hypothetical protein